MPRWQTNAESALDFLAIETGICRPFRASRIISCRNCFKPRDRIATIAQPFINCLSKPVPCRLACRGDVVDAGSSLDSCFPNLHESIDYGSRQIEGSGWRPMLIVNHA